MNTIRKRRRLHARRTARKSNPLRMVLVSLLGLAAFGSIAAAAGIGALFVVYRSYANDYVPIEDKLRQTQIGLTEIYDRNGIPLGALPNPDAQLLNPVPLDQISKYLIDATVSTEDNTFWENPGINYEGLLRAGFEYLQGGVNGGTGGSSITQQLIKNVYICPNIADTDTPVCARSLMRSNWKRTTPRRKSSSGTSTRSRTRTATLGSRPPPRGTSTRTPRT
jgi:membrane peptidoglycan carboxypeptidase